MGDSHDSLQQHGSLLSADARRAEVKSRLKAAGMTVTEWASRNGYRPKLVYKVLAGESRALFGKGHEIAVKLGIKDGTIGDAADV